MGRQCRATNPNEDYGLLKGRNPQRLRCENLKTPNKNHIFGRMIYGVLLLNNDTAHAAANQDC